MPLDEFERWVGLYAIEDKERKRKESVARTKNMARSANPRLR